MKNRKRTEPVNSHFKVRYIPSALVLIILILFVSACTSPEPPNNGFNVPEGFTIEPVVDSSLIAYPFFASFDPDGRLFVFESTEANEMSTEDMLAEPSYQVRLLTDTDQDGIFDESTVYADKIPFPMGGTFHDGSLYVVASPDLLKLTDTNGDGIADEREVVLTGWTLNVNGAILSGPFMGPDGRFYMAGARRGFDVTSQEGVRFQGKGARIWRCLPDGSELEWLSGGGFDNSIEIDFMPSGDPIGTMTYFRDPADGQRDALMHWVKGGVYPKPQAVIAEDKLKLTGDLMPVVTKMPRVAPSGIVRFRGDQWGSDYEGAWFSAIFNTGQILRHNIRPEGSSYVSEEETFLSANLPDIHPTDVLQDGNGNMLVVVTGGWFIKGCPLSRVAKPNVPGGIYRIKKNGTPEKKDPWGTTIAFSEMTPEETLTFVEDDRPLVRKKALEHLIALGGTSTESLSTLYESEDELVRLEAIYALHRIGTEKGNERVRSGLLDAKAEVRTAAARLSGLAKDQQAVSTLMNLVVTDPSLPVRRQAATALGQIGDAESVPALIEASVNAEDRFLLHAIRYALITLNQTDPMVSALNHTSSSVRITALMVLDQLDDSPLTKEQVRPFLDSEEKPLQEAGIWVTRHHSEWSSMVTDYLKGRLNAKTLSEEELDDLKNLMISFCGDSEMQSYIRQTLTRSSSSEPVRLALLGVMRQCAGSVPQEWIVSLGKQLQSSSEVVRSTALSVIETRQIEELEPELTNLLASSAQEPALYLKVLNARLTSQPELSEKEFGQVQSYMDSTFSMPVRRSAIQVMDRASLNEDQLVLLAKSSLPEADEVVFPGLVRVFEKDSTAEIGELVVGSLLKQQDLLGALSEQDLTNVLKGYPTSVQQSAEPLMETLRQQNANRLSQLHAMEEGLVKGDVGRGRDLFFGKAICSTCHAIGQDGDDFGPDLTNIGAIRSKHDLLEAIAFPSVSFAREYETYVIKTAERTYTGVLKESLAEDVVVVKTAPGQEIRIAREDILSMEPGDLSLMPPGLDQALSNQELSDLIAFMEALPYTVDRLLELSE
ncbi:HEAT repeat domain-containing protein [Membranicola marinus]|uniref:HEAT repeat domain-containing protein n=1 Tax=Membranihabitans marinus TaxID=1227546 RepID=A0A953LBL4_9BACT|nr:HEAT repeat domain-containing protein [Membranihabitans marinus]MBY5958661.1 HEAT repeat domain-containing protein [Membranihabitans marinus]